VRYSLLIVSAANLLGVCFYFLAARHLQQDLAAVTKTETLDGTPA
jgi:hypothetical protein